MTAVTNLVPIRCGAARVTITPGAGIELSGYPFVTRLATDAHDDLYATALVFGEGADRVALVSVDLIAVGAGVIDRTRRLIQQRLGLASERVMIAATHTHSGPSMAIGDLFDEGVVGQPDDAFTDAIPTWITAAVDRAIANSQPRLLGVGYGRVDPPVGRNRRSPEGMFDPAVPVVAVFDQDRKPVAIAISHACHPTVLQADNLRLSSDLAWGVRQGVANRLGPEVITAYVTGAAGDQSTRATRRAATFSETARLGDILAAAIERAVGELARRPDAEHAPTPRAARATTTFPVRSLPSLDQAIEAAKRADEMLARLQAEGADGPLVRTAEVTSFGAHHTVRYARQAATRPFPREVAAEIQALAIGPARVLGVPVELFVELGLTIQDRAPGPRPMIVAYANNLLGYVPTRAAFGEGGYEPAVTLLGPETGERLVDKATSLLGQLNDQPALDVPRADRVA